MRTNKKGLQICFQGKQFVKYWFIYDLLKIDFDSRNSVPYKLGYYVLSLK